MFRFVRKISTKVSRISEWQLFQQHIHRHHFFLYITTIVPFLDTGGNAPQTTCTYSSSRQILFQIHFDLCIVITSESKQNITISMNSLKPWSYTFSYVIFPAEVYTTRKWIQSQWISILLKTVIPIITPITKATTNSLLGGSKIEKRHKWWHCFLLLVLRYLLFVHCKTTQIY